MSLIFDNQIKVLFDEPIKITEDNIRRLSMVEMSLETRIHDDPNLTFGPRRPNIKDAMLLIDHEREEVDGVLLTFERGLAKTGQIGLLPESIKENIALSFSVQDFDTDKEDLRIERVEIFK